MQLNPNGAGIGTLTTPAVVGSWFRCSRWGGNRGRFFLAAVVPVGRPVFSPCFETEVGFSIGKDPRAARKPARPGILADGNITKNNSLYQIVQ